MNTNKIYEFFLHWELMFRNGECLSFGEYQAMSPEDVATANSKAFQAFMEADNPL